MSLKNTKILLPLRGINLLTVDSCLWGVYRISVHTSLEPTLDNAMYYRQYTSNQ